MNHLIGIYKNGNYVVSIFEDGTKIRTNPLKPAPGQQADEYFNAAFPESMDVTITHRCDAGCEMCYAGCTMAGENADLLNAKWIDALHPYTEMAIGGGNIFEHPHLVPFLEKLKANKVLANITVNQRHFIQHFDEIQSLGCQNLVMGVGVSVFQPTDELFDRLAQMRHAVVHCILGVIGMDVLQKMQDRDLRLLLLGYKSTCRGASYGAKHRSAIDAKIAEVHSALPDLPNHFKVVSFDNLALHQLDVRSLLSDDEWSRFYMGDDGAEGKITSATMFIDMVDRFYTINSMDPRHYEISDSDTPASMFQSLKKHSLPQNERIQL